VYACVGALGHMSNLCITCT